MLPCSSPPPDENPHKNEDEDLQMLPFLYLLERWPCIESLDGAKVMPDAFSGGRTGRIQFWQ